jgi:hypothetical protein
VRRGQAGGGLPRRTLDGWGETAGMLLKRRLPRIDTSHPFDPKPGFEHLDPGEVALLRWLKEHQVDFVLVGSVAQAVHTGSSTAGPLAIVPAPYRRNLERLTRALAGAEARVRSERTLVLGKAQDAPARITVEDLMKNEVWSLGCGPHPIDVMGTAAPSASGAPCASGYQELLYEATRFELTEGLNVEVASPEDIEHYAHLRRTGTAPQMTISRSPVLSDDRAGEEARSQVRQDGRAGEEARSQVRQDGNDPAPTTAPHRDSPRG